MLRLPSDAMGHEINGFTIHAKEIFDLFRQTTEISGHLAMGFSSHVLKSFVNKDLVDELNP